MSACLYYELQIRHTRHKPMSAIKHAPIHIFESLVSNPLEIQADFTPVKVGECHEDEVTGWLRLAPEAPLVTLCCYGTEEAARDGLSRPALVQVEAGFSSTSPAHYDDLTAATLRMGSDLRLEVTDSERMIRRILGERILSLAIEETRKVPGGQLVMDHFTAG
jgi:hypothetical protein